MAAWNSTRCAGENYTTSINDQCLLGAPFDVSKSSTYISTGSQINTTTDETGGLFTGILSTDMLTVGSATLDTNFIVDYDAVADNILGLGYSLNESYTSLPQALVKSGQINSAAYSLWADDLRDNGTILFGGVNSAKYSGKLHTMTIPAADLPAVIVTDVYVQESPSTPVSTNTSGLPAYMIIDSYAYWTYLPDVVVERIYSDLNVSFGQNSMYDVPITDCGVGNQNYSITFAFSDFDINVPLSFFLYRNPNTDSCEFTIAPSGGEAGFLGSNFLHAVYTVFDLSNNEISLAQRNFNNSVPDNILEIGNSSTNAIPGAVSASTVTVTVAVPPTATEPPWPQILLSPPTSSIPTSQASPTSTAAKNIAAPTLSSINNKLAASLMCAWLCFALTRLTV